MTDDDDPWGPPSWIFGDTPEPEGVAAHLYLDYADDPERWVPVAQRWHDELLAIYTAAARGTAEPPVLRSASRQDWTKVRRPGSWAAMLVPELRLGFQEFAERSGAAMLTLHLKVDRFADRQLVLSMGCAYPREDAADVLPPIVDAVHRVASVADPAYGEIGPAAGADPPHTALDLALGRRQESAEESRARLRGYAWVTICPREIAARLDPARLAAFAEVRALAHGGLLLRATPTPEEYGPASMRATFLALAPALPPGLPRCPRPLGVHSVVLADASQYVGHVGEPVPDAELPLPEPPRQLTPEAIAAVSSFAASLVAENLVTYESADDIIPEGMRELLAGHVKPVLTEEGERRAAELRRSIGDGG